ncbi:putative pentatricopeptide repeat-containing protein At1g77010, mitochondrial [Magnolia sinica]|uniref:putative pentatricopeptide repeat-containing protein At1g77010, mitochondrial n=1 Tax=Magnolia sinica TaxID=86752 RepID=UPI002657F7CD|nr:putative pentatricopeptide repeat-containing protein At1g77010, mitochondrial [Magnolia sinica]
MALDFHSCASLLRSCRTHCSILQGKQIHVILFKTGLDSVLFFGNCLLQMYTRCGDMSNVRRLFDEMSQRNKFTWNALLEAYLKAGDYKGSIELFNSMPHKNVFSWNAVISGFAKCGNLETARQLFNDMPMRNATAWNSMIHGYVRHGRPQEALWLFKSLKLDSVESSQIDNFILATAIGACANLEALDCGKQIHTHIVVSKVEFDSVLGSSLVNMYGKCKDLDSASHVLNLMKEPDEFSLSALISGYANCGRLIDALSVFHRRNNPSAVLWNSMIAGYVANNDSEEALQLFNMMRLDGIQADSSTFASVLSACAILCALEDGKKIHAYACKVGIANDMIVASTLVDMYSKCGSSDDACNFFSELEEYDTILLNSMISVYSNCGRIQDARWVFNMMPQRSLISWNSMIVGYSHNNCAIEALDLFREMHRLNLRMDKVGLASVISTSASICSLGLGEQIFAHATIIGLESDQIISTSLVNLYCKCGNVEDGRRVFDEMRKFNEVPWNSMLMGYATNGYGKEALKLFEDMRNAGVRPNDITFVGVLSGCSHSGLVEEGLRWFHAMKNNYHIDPMVEHYSCMIDLFARAGCLEEAMDFIDKMPFKADVSMWSSVLRGCKACGNESLGRKAAEQLIKLDPENSGAYVQLSNIYAARGEWERSALVRNMMLERRVRKKPGCSWVDD